MAAQCGATCAKYILFIFNFIFFLSGGALLGIGIWVKLDKTVLNYLLVVNIDQSDPFLKIASFMFIAVGGFTFIIGFLGCCGAIRESQCLLFCYAASLILILLAEVAAGVLVLMYRKKIDASLRKSMYNQVHYKYGANTSMDNAWNFLQHNMDCCGGNNYTDYQQSLWWNKTAPEPGKARELYVPKTCCVLSSDDYQNPVPVNNEQCQEDARNKVTSSQHLNMPGCHPQLSSWFAKHSLIIMSLGFAVGALQLVGIVLACCLRSAIKREFYNY